NVSFHSSARYLMVTSNSGCSIIDLETQQPMDLPKSLAGSSAAAWNSVGDWIAGGSARQVHLWRFPSLELGPTQALPGVPNTLTFSDDGQRLAIGCGRNALVWDWKEAVAPVELPCCPGTISQLAFSRTGNSLAVLSEIDQSEAPYESRIFSLSPGSRCA